MSKKLLSFAVLISVLLFDTTCWGQQLSNMGRDFWIGYGHHVRMVNQGSGQTSAEKMQLYITSDVVTTAKVAIPSTGFEQSIAVIPNQISTVDIPRSAALFNEGLSDLGIHVTADAPVVVYSFIYVSAVSGATVCLPTNTLGRDYYSVNFEQLSNEANCSSYFFVVAADTGTTSVEITPSAATKGGRTANQPFLVQLKQGQVYQVLGTTNGNKGVDLTGSRIRSVNTGSGCKKIAVFSGSSKISIGCASAGTSDNLYQQAYPTATWSRKYIATPSLQNSYNFYRIIRPDPTSIVKVNGQVVPASSFTNNFYYQFSGNSTYVIESDKAIMVAQYFPSEGCAGNNGQGDPEMVYLNPVDQTLKQVTLNAMQPAGVNIRTHYLNVVLPNDTAAINSFRLDGLSYNNFQVVPGDNAFAYAQIPTQQGTHTLTCTQGFNVVAYGFGSAESYGYSGGARLRDLYQFAAVQNQYASLDYAATCSRAPFRLSITFPFQPQAIHWNFNDVLPNQDLLTPQYDSSWQINGKTVYRYTVPGWLKAPAAGTYPVKVIATSNIGDGCTSEVELEHDLVVTPSAEHDFSITTRACLGDTVFLQQLYKPGGNLAAVAYSWNLGNGSQSVLPNPSAQYQQPGTYTIAASVINEIGCLSDTATRQITINPLPQARFSVQGPLCAGREIGFVNESFISSGSIAGYTWNFGDGKTLVSNDVGRQIHSFSTTGNYITNLVAVSDKGCISMPASQRILVHAVPKAGFKIPGSCLRDPYSEFLNTTTLSEQAALRYTWNFGDANQSITNTDTLQNPRHQYRATGMYPVTLVVNSAYGCADTLVQQLYINGSVPEAHFSLLNGLRQCSDGAILVKNESQVDVGELVKMELYWNYGVDATQKTIDLLPKKDSTYRFQMPSFFNPANKQYTIRMVAYSGQSCYSVAEKTVVLDALPQLRFDTLPAFCSADPQYTITQAQLQNGLPGKGWFSGNGIQPSGFFTPALAQMGSNPISYTYTTNQGCTSVAIQTARVSASPRVNAGPDMIIRQGKTETIRASAIGQNLRFQWTPGTGLNNVSRLQPLASPLSDQVYRLTATTPEGCSAWDEVGILAPADVFIPNSFTPNGDGINDRWQIPFLMQSDGAQVRVYSRDGFMVYENKGAKVAWDGNLRGLPLPAGTYVYYLSLSKDSKTYKGTITLVR
ncbi:gliding motility-associated C-terminal domain-containing protein [Cnuella takakiae]|uniref:Gliding motility-associated C-terminal domain-containing protein n=1 Tax=Cnuella takakiae TaxID=1302690 RepID=A0A1M4XX60_9BACT|nr:gliding motility-associated C-terminal domain-containing protein [Cnuella takakiae]OLY92980.1 hypothetical protein BUE76_14570 [Cnuella takakiae]SHE98174.1 gliding motility-associated C-terminal domain-containing protein [Cnuella takakiae]